MGIKGLNNFLRKKCVGVFNNIQLKDLAYKKLAIDISLYMCKYKVVCGDRWLSAFLTEIGFTFFISISELNFIRKFERLFTPIGVLKYLL